MLASKYTHTKINKWGKHGYIFFFWGNPGNRFGFLGQLEVPFCFISPLWTKCGTSVKRALWPWAQQSFVPLFITMGRLPRACLLLLVREHWLPSPGKHTSLDFWETWITHSCLILCVDLHSRVWDVSGWEYLKARPIYYLLAPSVIFLRYLSVSLMENMVIFKFCKLSIESAPGYSKTLAKRRKGRNWTFIKHLTMDSQP